MAKEKPVTVIENGVPVTYVPYKEPKDAQKTWPKSKSRYTQWAVGVTKYANGSRGIQGTVDTVS
jgi:hypothetical protein